MSDGSAGEAVLTAYARKLITYQARQLSRRRGFRRCDQDDVVQELTMALLAKAHLFNPARASASTFADRVIRSAAAMLLRDRRRLKRAAGFTALSLEDVSVRHNEEAEVRRDALTDEDFGRRLGRADDTERAERIEAVREVLQSLPPEDRSLCLLRVSGSEASVARALNMSTRHVREAIARIRNRFEAGGFGNF